MKASGRKRGECGDAVNEQGTERRSASARDTQGRGRGVQQDRGRGGSVESSFSRSQDVRENRARRCLDKSV